MTEYLNTLEMTRLQSKAGSRSPKNHPGQQRSATAIGVENTKDGSKGSINKLVLIPQKKKTVNGEVLTLKDVNDPLEIIN